MLQAEDVARYVDNLRTSAGYDPVKIIQLQHTDNPSIQGPWTPWINNDPKLLTTSFPSVS